MTYPNPVEQESGEREGPASKGIRVGGQLLGLVLILIGAYYAVLILGACIGVLRDPGQTSASVASMTKTIGLEGAEVPSGKNQIPIGKACAGVLLLLWYQVAAWISLKLMTIGGRMVTSDRREFLSAMREFMLLTRIQK
jgi:hypothetical protein